MRLALSALAAIAVIATSAQAAPALDAAGKCRDNGKFVASAMCKKPMPASRCKDAKGKFAKCGTPGAVPVTK